MGHIVRCRRLAFRDCTGFTMRCLGEEAKAGKARSLGDLRRNNVGKTEE